MIDTKWLDELELIGGSEHDYRKLIAIARRMARFQEDLEFQISECAKRYNAKVFDGECFDGELKCNCSDRIYLRLLNG